MEATGTPPGICTVERSASSPLRGLDSIGTPITGSVVSAAMKPARWAALPGPGYNNFYPAFFGALRVEGSPSGCPVRGGYGYLVWDIEFLKDVNGLFHDAQVRVAAHHYANERF